MEQWNTAAAQQHVCRFDRLSRIQQHHLINILNESFPLPLFKDHCAKRRAALNNNSNYQNLLTVAAQKFPVVQKAEGVAFTVDAMRSCALMFTAGGEGERLRLSLLEKGVPSEQLVDFTKATFPLPGLTGELSTLAINLRMVATIGRELSLDIPVIISTGPAGSVTARVIPELLSHNNWFGLKQVTVIAQDERLHLTDDEQIVYSFDGSTFTIATNPDETGGPLMKLKKSIPGVPHTSLDWLASRGKMTLIVLQATAIFNKELIAALALNAQNHDCVGVGIARNSFAVNDPFGSFVLLGTQEKEQLVILEQAVRSEATRALRNRDGDFLPYNTGFYALHTSLLQNCNLPDYATPPKEIVPGLPRAPKIGYAATDIFGFARNPLVLTIDPEWYGVLKNSDDLPLLAVKARQLNLV